MSPLEALLTNLINLGYEVVISPGTRKKALVTLNSTRILILDPEVE